MFLATLSITHAWIDTAMSKIIKKDAVPIDNRGKTNVPRPYAISTQIEETVMTHIHLIPRVDSHYTRKDSQRQYFEQKMSFD